ncbi:hypothetical protein HK104_005771 [Borealophlyctis nickersoniae]|nr:hypothetical protein HK104_005771 [Borealophlyctis nickersoniae]
MIESWTTFAIYLAVELAAMTFELCHEQSSSAGAFVYLPRLVLGQARRKLHSADHEKCEKKSGPTAVLPPSALDLHHGVEDNIVYGAVTVSFFLPAWYYGPNQEAYIFDFPSYEVPVSILKIWLSVLASLIHFAIAVVYLKRVKHIDAVAIWKRMCVKYYDYFFAAYISSPIFPASQMGKEWNTIWFLRKIGGLRMTSHD